MESTAPSDEVPDGEPAPTSVASLTASLSSSFLHSVPPRLDSLPAANSTINKVDQLTIECRICFDEKWVMNTMYMCCCGMVICIPCYNAWLFKDAGTRGTCPNCRAPLYGEKEVLLLLSQHIAAGKIWAHYELAKIYYHGQEVVRRSGVKALEHALIAAKGGEVRAFQYVATIYDDGDGVTHSSDKALEYFTKGSDAGIECCSYNLGVHSSEEGPFYNPTKAIHYMKLAVHQHSVAAHWTLGNWYLHGDCGLPVDEAKGVALVMKAANDGLQNAQFTLASQYLQMGCFSAVLKYCHMSIRDIPKKDENWLLNTLNPMTDAFRVKAMFLITLFNEEGSFRWPIESYLWLKKYLATCPPTSVDTNAEAVMENALANLVSSCSNCKSESGPDLPVSLARCGGCGVVSYCSKVCQRAHWAAHREICRQIREVGGRK